MNFRAFTIIELLVSVAIFTMMTALVVAKYGNFNQSVLLTNLAYDVALTIRTAQTYGLSVKSSDNSSSQFLHGYGVRFDTDSITSEPTLGVKNNQEIVFFADINDSLTFNSGDTPISRYAIKRGAIISGICVSGVGCTPLSNSPSPHHIDIIFKRPDPNAKICLDNSGVGQCAVASTYPYVEITVQGTDGSIRVVTVRENGQIAVKD